MSKYAEELNILPFSPDFFISIAHIYIFLCPLLCYTNEIAGFQLFSLFVFHLDPSFL